MARRTRCIGFAGGAVVHISSGISALVCALMLGRRQGYGTDYMAPHNLPMVLLEQASLGRMVRLQCGQRARRE